MLCSAVLCCTVSFALLLLHLELSMVCCALQAAEWMGQPLPSEHTMAAQQVRNAEGVTGTWLVYLSGRLLPCKAEDSLVLLRLLLHTQGCCTRVVDDCQPMHTRLCQTQCFASNLSLAPHTPCHAGHGSPAATLPGSVFCSKPQCCCSTPSSRPEQWPEQRPEQPHRECHARKRQQHARHGHATNCQQPWC